MEKILQSVSKRILPDAVSFGVSIADYFIQLLLTKQYFVITCCKSLYFM